MITEERYGPLAQMEVKDFVFTVGARSPSPGGGSVAALSASMVVITSLHSQMFKQFCGFSMTAVLLKQIVFELI